MFNKTKFTIKSYTDKTYAFLVANGQYAGWNLSLVAHHQKNNIYYIVISSTMSSTSYWRLEEVKGTAWDKTRFLICNSYYSNYIIALGTGWKRNNNSSFPICHKNSKPGGSWAAWRIQKAGGTSNTQAIIDSQN